ncbi:unnamed protein product [Bursaphelenchus okinawaensis]|uniref:Peptidase metallopeptidase domain-containing protein n=1 Tax=Bursaphelenchus okinawaensis TaxID=465554 RepID=A0A811KEX6_9BILA|nr:unnamed protein product [Bursaphelenchus okinawaensis]CAG9103363.1 unnamed protein product [Bursaphelenchus okinawaensis]
MREAILIVTFWFVSGYALPIDKDYAYGKLQKWTKCSFSYRIYDKYYLFRNEKDFLDSRRAIIKALNLWESESKVIKFYELSDQQLQPDIDITFAMKEHNCTEAFDGAGGIVAHSSYPPHGLIHFDAEEVWALDDKGLNLSYVALHELGHVLGLKHSDESKSIMNPVYKNGADKLSGQDIRRLRRLFSNCHRV